MSNSRDQAGKRCAIDGRQRSKRSVLARIARDLEFPSHFGGNLDALYDCLTTDIRGPIEIIWKPTKGSRQALGREFDGIVSVLRDASGQRDDLVFVLREPDGAIRMDSGSGRS